MNKSEPKLRESRITPALEKILQSPAGPGLPRPDPQADGVSVDGSESANESTIGFFMTTVNVPSFGEGADAGRDIRDAY